MRSHNSTLLTGVLLMSKNNKKIVYRLKSLIMRKVNSEMPGYLTMLDSIAIKKYGMNFLDLFFQSPSKAYELLKEYYGSEDIADFTMLRLFLRPIAVAFNDIMLEDKLMLLLKKNDEKSFLKILGLE